MSDASNLRFTVQFVDPELDSEERDEQAMRLLSELRDVDELEEVGRVLDPNPPEGNKSLGGFLVGMLRGEVEPGEAQPILGLIGDRAAHKHIEMQLDRNDRSLRVVATSREDLQEVMPLLQQFMAETSQKLEAPIDQRTILVLAANPSDTTRLSLDNEVRDIEEGLKLSKHRDRFVLKTQLAVRPRDVQRAMLEYKPSIVHFSGHAVAGAAGTDGLVFEDDKQQSHLIDGESLAELFDLFSDRLECVVLNGCHSKVQADAIARHIKHVVGMSKAITDRAAIEFAVGFYDALGAGESFEFAFNLGRNRIRLARLKGHDIPMLMKGAALAVG